MNKKITDDMKDLLAEAKEVNKDIAATNKESRETMDTIESKVDRTISEVESIYADLDRIEREAGDELDTHLLQQAEDLARE